MKKVDIYTDGSCKKNPGPGGWAAVLCFDGKEKKICGGEECTTNNRMELTAVISALKMLKEPCHVTLTTDSKYVSDGITLGWAKSWKKNGWKKSDKSPALNPELWDELLSLCEKHEVEFVWVKGHAGHPYNERCDTMAQGEAAKFAKMKIGLVVAIEMDSVFEYYKNAEKLPSPAGFELYRTESGGREIYILRTGMGLVAASAGVQYLITGCGVQTVVNFGVVGGLTEDMRLHKVCVVERVVHYKYDCSEFMDLKIGQVDGHGSVFLPTDKKMVKKALAELPDLVKVTCCSGDKFIGTAEEKKRLHDDFEGDVCDMESAGIVLTCEMNGVPCLLLKAVSDGLADGAGGFYNELKSAGTKCLEAAGKIIESL